MTKGDFSQNQYCALFHKLNWDIICPDMLKKMPEIINIFNKQKKIAKQIAFAYKTEEQKCWEKTIVQSMLFEGNI